MFLEVYPDIVFIINFIIDFIFLFLLKKISRKNGKKKMLLIAAAAGAVIAAVVCLFLSMNIILRFFLMNIIAPIIMIWIAFGRLKKVDLIKQVILLYLLTYFVGGFINSIYYYTDFRLQLIKIGNTMIVSNISYRMVLPMFLILVPSALVIITLYRTNQSKKKELYEIELSLDDKSIHTIGLLDTGNCLYDPIFHRPVMVAERSLLEDLLSEEYRRDLVDAYDFLKGNQANPNQWSLGDNNMLRFRYIPYRSIGKADDYMLGIIIDKLLVNTGKEMICNEKVIVAICDISLSMREEYHVILHKQFVGF